MYDVAGINDTLINLLPFDHGDKVNFEIHIHEDYKLENFISYVIKQVDAEIRAALDQLSIPIMDDIYITHSNFLDVEQHVLQILKQYGIVDVGDTAIPAHILYIDNIYDDIAEYQITVHEDEDEISVVEILPGTGIHIFFADPQRVIANFILIPDRCCTVDLDPDFFAANRANNSVIIEHIASIASRCALANIDYSIIKMLAKHGLCTNLDFSLEVEKTETFSITAYGELRECMTTKRHGLIMSLELSDAKFREKVFQCAHLDIVLLMLRHYTIAGSVNIMKEIFYWRGKDIPEWALESLYIIAIRSRYTRRMILLLLEYNVSYFGQAVLKNKIKVASFTKTDESKVQPTLSKHLFSLMNESEEHALAVLKITQGNLLWLYKFAEVFFQRAIGQFGTLTHHDFVIQKFIVFLEEAHNPSIIIASLIDKMLCDYITEQAQNLSAQTLDVYMRSCVSKARVTEGFIMQLMTHNRLDVLESMLQNRYVLPFLEGSDLRSILTNIRIDNLTVMEISNRNNRVNLVTLLTLYGVNTGTALLFSPVTAPALATPNLPVVGQNANNEATYNTRGRKKARHI